MRTSIVVKRWGEAGHLARSPLPSEATEQNKRHTPVYAKASTIEGHDLSSKSGKNKRQKMPEHVSAHSCMFEFESGRVDRVRIMPPQYVEAINDLDGERARLQAKLDDVDNRERALLGAAYDLGTPIERAKAIELFSRKATEPAATRARFT